VARGWTTIVDRAGRLVVPDDAVTSTVARVRSQLVLTGPADPADDGAAFLLDVGELVRMGERPAPWTLDVAEAVSSVARRPDSWEALAALDAAAIVLALADEPRALRDLDRLRPTDLQPLPTTPPTSAAESYVLAWHEQRLARRAAKGRAELLANGIPSPWLGANFEIYGIPAGPATTVSYAIRWHGDRPAVLWETDGPTIELTSPVIAPQWSTGEAKGEALWPPVATDVGPSFS